MANKKVKPAAPKKAAAKTHNAGPDYRGRCRVCGAETKIKTVVKDGLEQHVKVPATCPNCGKVFRYDVPGPWVDKEDSK